MNQALDYIESNLSDEIDYSVAAQHMSCSVWEFQRIFSFMAQVPLSEYIRRRRLTLAAHDIQASKDKIINVALRYGYDSPASFSRAFNQLHGTTPKSARDDGVTLKIFPRFAFQFILKGVVPMDYKIEEKEAFQVIGITKRMTTVNDEDRHQMRVFRQEWFKMNENADLFSKYAKGEPHDFCISIAIENTADYNATSGYAYNGAENTDKLNILTVPGGTWVVFNIPDDYRNRVGEFQGRCLAEYLPATSYKLAGVHVMFFSFPKSPESPKSIFEAWFLVK
jgi:AraC family transcriptional regulator